MPLAWKQYREDRGQRTGDDLATGLAEQETDCCDELAVPARHRLIAVHELICVEREGLRLDLVPAVREKNVLDLMDLNTERHLRTSRCVRRYSARAGWRATHGDAWQRKRPPQKAEASSSFTVIVTRKTNESVRTAPDRRWPGWVLKLGQA